MREGPKQLCCGLIGEGSLLIACGDVLLRRQHPIALVASGEQAVAAWAASKHIPSIGLIKEGLTGPLKKAGVDYLFSIANPEVLDEGVLHTPRCFAINYHDSLLPRYAGNFATSWAIINGERCHGITWHVMRQRVDSGPIVRQVEIPITAGETAMTLNVKCFDAALRSFEALLGDLERGKAAFREQDLTRRTFFARNRFPPFGGVIHWDIPAQQIERLVRALDFGAYANPSELPKILVDDQFFVPGQAVALELQSGALPGTVVSLESEALVIATADGAIRISALERLNGAPLKLDVWAKERGIRPGMRLPNPGSAVVADSVASALTTEERHRILAEWNNTAADYPADKCIHQLFEDQVQRHPDAMAVSDDVASLTYGQLNDRAEQLASKLRRVGVGRGSLVGVYMDRSVNLIAALFGILKAGGAYVPLDRQWPKTRLARITSSASIMHWVTQRSLMETARAVQAEAPCLRTVVCPDGTDMQAGTQEAANAASPPSPDDVAYVIFTSGSTGQPKGVVVRHRPVINVVDWVNKKFNVGPADKILCVASVAFDLSVYDIFGMLAAGGTVRIATEEEVRDPARLLRILREEQITFWDSAPAALQQLVPTMQASSQKSSELRLVFLSGDWIPLTLPDAVKKCFPSATVVGLGGATEAAIWSNYHVIDKIDPAWKSIPYGRPIQNARYYVLDERLHPCPVGIPGRLYIGGQCLAAGYCNDPELTSRKFIADPFSQRPEDRIYDTGDLAKFWPDGTIEFLGRADQQVKIRGFRIELGEIEAALCSHPGVQQAVVVARESSNGSKQLIGYVVPKTGTAPSPDELRGHLSGLVPQYMIPHALILIKEIPVTPNGKVDRKALPNPDLNQLSRSRDYEAPATDLEKRLACVWQKVLGVNQVGRSDNFFELGGDSLSTVAVSAVAIAIGLDIGPAQIFQNPTIAQLAALVKPLRRQTGRPCSNTEENIPLTPIQHWLFERNLRDPQNYNIVFVFDVDRKVNPAALESALRQVAGQHDAFRLRFHQTDGRWVQRLAEGTVQCGRVDLTRLPEEQRDSAIQAELLELRQGLDLSHGPLCKALLFDLGGRWKLGLVIHHLIFDAASLRIFIDHLQAVYTKPGRVVSAGSFSQWAQHLAAYAQTKSAAEYLDQWVAMPWKQVRPMPVDFPGGGNTYRSSAVIQRTLNAVDTRALLREASSSPGVSTGEVLLGAWGRAFAAWANAEAVLVDVTGHGRERFLPDFDVSGTIGYVTTISPAILLSGQSIPGIRPPDQSWGVLRYLHPSPEVRARLAALPVAQVKFNYQGQAEINSQHGILRGPLALSIPGALHPDNQRAYILNIELAVVDGQLQCRCMYGKELHRQDSIEALLDRFSSELHDVASELQQDSSTLAVKGARS